MTSLLLTDCNLSYEKRCSWENVSAKIENGLTNINEYLGKLSALSARSGHSGQLKILSLDDVIHSYIIRKYL